MIFIETNNNIILENDYAVMIIESPTYGVFNIKIDVEDMEMVKKYKWCIGKFIRKERNTLPTFYASADRNRILLHRYLTNAPKGKVVDHISGDSNDNRNSNLRICTTSENRMNIKTPNNNKSGFKGVCWFKNTNRWKAYICIDKKRINLGYFLNIEDAIEARLQAELKYFGEYRNVHRA